MEKVVQLMLSLARTKRSSYWYLKTTSLPELIVDYFTKISRSSQIHFLLVVTLKIRILSSTIINVACSVVLWLKRPKKFISSLMSLFVILIVIIYSIKLSKTDLYPKDTKVRSQYLCIMWDNARSSFSNVNGRSEPWCTKFHQMKYSVIL